MFKIRNKQLILIVFTIFTVFMVFASFINSKVASIIPENKSKELPTPISFINSNQIANNSILIESIPFELSEVNSIKTYLITEGYEDLIFSFKNVSAPINFSLKTENGESHHAGFSGTTNTIYIKTNPNSQYEFNWSLGFINSDNTSKQTDLVNFSSGILEIFKVIK